MELKKGYKQTEVGVIPSDWAVRNIGELTEVSTGGTPSTRMNEYWNGSIRWMNSGELNYKRVYDVENRITEIGLNNSATRIIPEKCVLIGLAGQGKTRGTVAMNMVELCTNQSIASIHPSELYDSDYLYFNLDSRYSELRIQSTGDGGRGGLNLRIIKQLAVPLPSKKEQTAIATALSDADALITGLEKLIAKKRAIKTACVEELMSGKKRLHGFEDRWKRYSIAELSRIFTKQTGFDYSAYIKPNLVTKDGYGVIPFVQNKDFNERWVNFNTDYFIPEDVANQFPKILLDEKCLLISISGSVGKVGVFGNLRKAFLGGAIAVAKFHDKTQLDWVMCYLLSTPGQKQLLDNVKSGSHQNLILDDIRKVYIPVPEMKERNEITELIFSMSSEIEILESKLSKLVMIKYGMMQNLLMGKIRLI